MSSIDTAWYPRSSNMAAARSTISRRRGLIGNDPTDRSGRVLRAIPGSSLRNLRRIMPPNPYV